MPDPVEDGARAAAARLATTHGPRLVTDVEAALYTRSTRQAPPDGYFDPVTIALAALIVQAADLAWTIYRDHQEKHTTPPAPDYVARQVRTVVRQTRTLDDGTEQAIEITVEETFKALPPAE